MTHLDWAVLYSGMSARYKRLRSGKGSDGNVYNVLRSLRDFWTASLQSLSVSVRVRSLARHNTEALHEDRPYMTWKTYPSLGFYPVECLRVRDARQPGL